MRPNAAFAHVFTGNSGLRPGRLQASVLHMYMSFLVKIKWGSVHRRLFQCLGCIKDTWLAMRSTLLCNVAALKRCWPCIAVSCGVHVTARALAVEFLA